MLSCTTLLRKLLCYQNNDISSYACHKSYFTETEMSFLTNFSLMVALEVAGLNIPGDRMELSPKWQNVSVCLIITEAHKGHHCKYFFRKVLFISARFYLFPQGFFLFPQVFFLLPQGYFYFRKVYLSPQGFVNFRKVCFISARLYYFRKVYFISARLFLFPRGLFLFRKVYFTSAKNIFSPSYKWPGPTSTLVVTIENIFAEIKVTLRK